jgi:hypothetical protein
MANECLSCLKQFRSKNALKGHTGTADPKLRVSHVCRKCDRRFCSQRAMEQHRDSPNHPTTNCGVCNRTFGSNQAVAGHKKSQSHKSMVARAERARLGCHYKCRQRMLTLRARLGETVTRMFTLLAGFFLLWLASCACDALRLPLR